MARDHEEYGESMRKDTKADPDEGCNAFYTRKQRAKRNRNGPDTDMPFVEEDRDAEAAASDVRDKDGFINYKRWDRYGGRT